MNILLTNDDGIRAEGIGRLAEALRSLGDLYVSAPVSQRSGAGHAITINRAFSVTETEFPGAVRAMAVDGTPADCVKIAFYLLERDGVKPDIVFSGVNHGGNLGTDTLYSGTVAGAVEGVICGSRYGGVAVSIESAKPRSFETATRLALKAGRSAFAAGAGGVALNINVPNLLPDEIKGVRITRVGLRDYNETFDEQAPDAPGGSHLFTYSGSPLIRDSRDADEDVEAHRKGYATITPLFYDLTLRGAMDELRKRGLEE